MCYGLMTSNTYRTKHHDRDAEHQQAFTNKRGAHRRRRWPCFPEAGRPA